MKDSISKTNIKKFNKEFSACPTFKIARNALTRSDINEITGAISEFFEKRESN